MRIRLKGYVKRRIVYFNDKVLKPFESQRLRNHSPDGFCWGYLGSGPAQLALAVLLEACKEANLSQDIALKNYQNFKTNIIAAIGADFDFDITINIKKYLE